jgi:hypothetical protein
LKNEDRAQSVRVLRDRRVVGKDVSSRRSTNERLASSPIHQAHLRANCVRFDQFRLQLDRPHFHHVSVGTLRPLRSFQSYGSPSQRMTIPIENVDQRTGRTSRIVWISMRSRYERVISRPSMSTSALNITDCEPISVALTSYKALATQMSDAFFSSLCLTEPYDHFPNRC